MELDGNKWITLLAMSFLCFAGFVIAVVFFIDPFLYYRNISNDKKLMEPRFTDIGIIKNYKHDMTILGLDSNNSMDMLYIRNYHERKPIQLGIEESNINDVLMLYTLAQENSKSDFYFINVRTEDFLENIAINLASAKFPAYLYNRSRLDDIKYLLNYEICFRYILLNTIIDTAFKLNKSLPDIMRDGTQIDKAAQWKKDTLSVSDLAKGKERVFYLKGIETTSVKEEDGKKTYQEIENTIDSYLDIILNQLQPDQTIVFGFMPYSAAYWASVSKKDFDTIMYAKDYFVKKCINLENIKLVDLQGIPEISDSSYYTKEQNMKEDFIKLYTDAVFNENIYENSKLFEKNRADLEKQIKGFAERE